MKKLLTFIFLLPIFSFAQQRSVAVLPSDGSILKPIEVERLTDKVRSAALQALPTRSFVLLKQDVVIKRLGGAENYIKECRESSCIVDLGKKAQVDYVAQASVSNWNESLRLKVELYNVKTEGLIDIYDEVYENIDALIEGVDVKVPEMFKKIPINSTVRGGIRGITSAGAYEYNSVKRHLVNIATEPEGAALSFNGMPISSCATTPCKAELNEGNVRIITALEQYEISDTTISITEDNRNILITLKPNFGILNIESAYSQNIGKSEEWNLTINDKPYSLGEVRLSPGRYVAKLSHSCYEDIEFRVGINKSRSEVFDMANHIVLKKGGLDLSAEKDGVPVREPVYVNGEKVGYTPFGGAVPICASIRVGSETVNINLKHNENVRYVHEVHTHEAENVEIAEKDRWGSNPILGFNLPIGLIDNSLFDWGLGMQFSNEYFIKDYDFFRLGWNIDLAYYFVNPDEIAKQYPDVIEIISGESGFAKINAFLKLYPFDGWYILGGAGFGYYGGYDFETEVGTIISKSGVFAPVFPVGTGIGIGEYIIDLQYNIVPFKDRIANYFSINFWVII